MSVDQCIVRIQLQGRGEMDGRLQVLTVDVTVEPELKQFLDCLAVFG